MVYRIQDHTSMSMLGCVCVCMCVCARTDTVASSESSAWQSFTVRSQIAVGVIHGNLLLLPLQS